MALFIDEQTAHIPLERLIAEGNEIVERENIPPSKFFAPELLAASVAVSRYDQAQAEWAEANDDEHMRKIRAEAQKNVARIRARVAELEADKLARKANGTH